MNKEIENAKSVLALLSEKFVNWYEIAVKSIPNILVALLIFIVFFLLAKIVKKITRNIAKKIINNRAIINLISSLSHMFILVLGLFISLEIMNLEKTVTSILAGAGVIGLALGFAFQEIASNFVSGVFISFQKPYKINDIVEVDNYLGQVKVINLRTTSIITFQGLEILIPNKLMFTTPLVNYTTTPERRLDLSVGVSYDDDLDVVEKVTTEVLKAIDGRIEHKEVEVYFEEFGGSSINLSARVWIAYPKDQNYLKAKHQLIKELKKAYDTNNISIPYPIRTLNVESKTIQMYKKEKES